ncbi:MAG: type II toxin-antitoxin system VapC family toxin [Acidobacteria bacterium]|nr:type II toxin-antitoxin system VapC family toxin [Acidobacteriota bacterium]
MIVLDTHVLIWAVDGDARLGRTARAAGVATARHCRAPILTADGAIRDYAAGGHVRAIDASR